MSLKRCRQKSILSFRESAKNESSQQIKRPKLKDIKYHSLDLDHLATNIGGKTKTNGLLPKKKSLLRAQESLDIIDEEHYLLSDRSSSGEIGDSGCLSRTRMKNLLNLIETNLNSLNELKNELNAKIE